MQGRSKLTSLRCPSDPHDDRRRRLVLIRLKKLIYNSRGEVLRTVTLEIGAYIACPFGARGPSRTILTPGNSVAPEWLFCFFLIGFGIFRNIIIYYRLAYRQLDFSSDDSYQSHPVGCHIVNFEFTWWVHIVNFEFTWWVKIQIVML